MLMFMGALFLVEEIAPSRHFYEHLLGQKVKYDFGPNVTFEGDFAIHLQSHYQALVGEGSAYAVTRRAHSAVLGFETDEIDALYRGLREATVEFIHAVREQPWGQRVMRLYDPDGHVVEIGENMEAVVWRLYREGWSMDRIREKTGMPGAFVERAIRGE